ncbi:MAG: hypothetical protein HN348_11805 [Proteobacteria bacterium]|nr:hypothetical protein [Pseudomonadota bacterium]
MTINILMVAYSSLWLIQQIPVGLLIVMLLVGALVGGPRAKVVLFLGALGLSAGFAYELWSVFDQGYPTTAGTWSTQWRWVLLAALLWVNHGPGQQFRLASVVGALAFAGIGAMVPAIVVVAFGMMEKSHPTRKVLAASIVGLVVAAALLHYKLWLWGVLKWVLGTSIDATTIITTLIIGFMDLPGWLLAIVFACLVSEADAKHDIPVLESRPTS